MRLSWNGLSLTCLIVVFVSNVKIVSLALIPALVVFLKVLFLLLGHLLFVLYTTPLNTLISSLSLNHHLYADDTQLFFSFYLSDLESSITHLQNALQQISSWMTANLLTLNSSKTEYLVCIFFRKEMSLTVPCDVSCMIGLQQWHI